MTVGTFRKRLRNEPTIGVVSAVVDSAVVESIAALGFDFYIADLEQQGPASDESCLLFLRTCQFAGIAPLIRAPLSETTNDTFARHGRRWCSSAAS